MPLPTTYLLARTVMDRAAAALNDRLKEDYTYEAQLPYLNMAIDELQESLEESNASPTNKTSLPVIVQPGVNKITPPDHPDVPHYPYDMIEIQEVRERLSGTTDMFVGMNRRDFLNVRPATDALIDWAWEEEMIKFNELGATVARDVQILYVRQPIQLAENENSFIGTIGSRSYLSFKTAAFCARFIGENPSRADELDDKAETALDRMLGIGSKGRQAIVTRRRPFRASYKTRGWF